MEINTEIAKRLRDFADSKGGPSALAKLIKVKPQTLNNYLSGKMRPGYKMQERLRSVGCDIGFLMTGYTEQSVQKKYDEAVTRLIEKGLSKEDYEMIDLLHGLQIKNRFELEECLDFKILTPRLLKVAETQAKYERTKRKEESK